MILPAVALATAPENCTDSSTLKKKSLLRTLTLCEKLKLPICVEIKNEAGAILAGGMATSMLASSAWFLKKSNEISKLKISDLKTIERKMHQLVFLGIEPSEKALEKYKDFPVFRELTLEEAAKIEADVARKWLVRSIAYENESLRATSSIRVIEGAKEKLAVLGYLKNIGEAGDDELLVKTMHSITDRSVQKQDFEALIKNMPEKYSKGVNTSLLKFGVVKYGNYGEMKHSSMAFTNFVTTTDSVEALASSDYVTRAHYENFVKEMRAKQADPFSFKAMKGAGLGVLATFAITYYFSPVQSATEELFELCTMLDDKIKEAVTKKSTMEPMRKDNDKAVEKAKTAT